MRTNAEQRYLYRLESVIRDYEEEWGVLPPASTTGSAPLVRALTTPTPSGQILWRVEPGDLDAAGNLKTPAGRIVRYGGPDNSGRYGFVLWVADEQGREIGPSTRKP